MKKNISRKTFLNQVSTIGAAAILSPIALQAAPVINNKQNNKKIKVGIIGCGSVSNMYLPHLSKSPYVELVSTCDIKPDRGKSQAEKYKIPNQYDHIDKMIAGAPFDLLVNLTNMQEHYALNKKAIQAGKHVWSEKPLANTYKQGIELLTLSKQKGTRLWGAPAVVNSPQFAFMSKAIQEGRLGKIAGVHGHYGHEGPEWSAFFYEELGGSMPDLAVYNLATITGLIGPVKSVSAMLNVITPTRNTGDKGSIKVVAEDNSMILMEHYSGTLSHVQSGFNYFDPYGHAGKGQDRPTISMWGKEGNMHLIGYDWAPAGVDMATRDHEETQRFVEDAENFQWQEGASVIAECLATGKEPIINVEHSLHVLEIIEAARESQKIGKRVQLQSKFKYPIIA